MLFDNIGSVFSKKKRQKRGALFNFITPAKILEPARTMNT